MSSMSSMISQEFLTLNKEDIKWNNKFVKILLYTFPANSH